MGEWLSDVRPLDPEKAIHAVFAVLSRHINGGQVDKAQRVLPDPIRKFWQSVSSEIVEA